MVKQELPWRLPPLSSSTHPLMQATFAHPASPLPYRLEPRMPPQKEQN